VETVTGLGQENQDQAHMDLKQNEALSFKWLWEESRPPKTFPTFHFKIKKRLCTLSTGEPYFHLKSYDTNKHLDGASN